MPKVAVGQVEDPVVDYVIAVNGEATIPLEGLPLNVKVVRRGNLCYDGGTAGEVLAGLDIRPYRFFIIMNSSVRGPFLPAYFARSHGGGLGPAASEHAPRGRGWTTALTDLLNDRVKLVGTTISCEIRVHVQSMVLATDRVGLEALWKAGTLDCARDRDEAIAKYELGASAAIMDKGYSVDCLMLRYQGVDWRAPEAAACNEMRNPFVPHYNDGIPINPLEVLFVKVKPHTLASDHALRRWSDYALGRDGDLTASHFDAPAVQRLVAARRQRLGRLVEDCGAAFDHDSFVRMYPSLDRGSPEATHAEFLDRHLASGHAFRYTLLDRDRSREEERGEGRVQGQEHEEEEEEKEKEKEPPQLPFHCQDFVRYGAPDLSTG